MATVDTHTRKRKLEDELSSEKSKLKRLESDLVRQAKSRQIKKARLMEVCEKNPDAVEILKVRQSAGRPRIEDACPEFLQTIIDIATIGGASDSRRRSEMIRSCKTLHELHEQLKKQLNFKISESAVYLRLLPHRSNTNEGKRHVKTVPVKLVKAQTSEHKLHIDTEFCLATIRAVETVASLLGPEQVFYLSQDDKVRIALGITDAKPQRPMLMHMEYKVTLPNHDWVKAERHKLIPSVYAEITIKKDGFGNPDVVTCLATTVIRIRSG